MDIKRGKWEKLHLFFIFRAFNNMWGGDCGAIYFFESKLGIIILVNRIYVNFKFLDSIVVGLDRQPLARL